MSLAALLKSQSSFQLSLTDHWPHKRTAHTERSSLTTCAEMSELIRQLHPSQQREGAQALELITESEEVCTLLCTDGGGERLGKYL